MKRNKSNRYKENWGERVEETESAKLRDAIRN